VGVETRRRSCGLRKAPPTFGTARATFRTSPPAFPSRHPTFLCLVRARSSAPPPRRLTTLPGTRPFSRPFPSVQQESHRALPEPSPPQNRFKGLFRKLAQKFSKKQSSPTVPPAPQPARVYEQLVDPSQLRDSPSPKPHFGYITGHRRSSLTPPTPAWLSRNVPLSPPSPRQNSYAEFTGSLGENHSFAIHSTLPPPGLTGRVPRPFPNKVHISPIPPTSPLLAPPSPVLTEKRSSTSSSSRTYRQYRPPTPPKTHQRRTRAPSAPEEPIPGDPHLIFHQRSISSPQPHSHPQGHRSQSTVSNQHISSTLTESCKSDSTLIRFNNTTSRRLRLCLSLTYRESAY
jgi:hypothetical protein